MGPTGKAGRSDLSGVSPQLLNITLSTSHVRHEEFNVSKLGDCRSLSHAIPRQPTTVLLWVLWSTDELQHPVWR